MVTALKVQPGEHPWPTLLCDDDDFLDCAVSMGADFYYTARACKVESGVAVIYGYEAAMLGGAGNRRINGRIYAGTIYIVGYHDDVLVSLSDADLARYTMLLWEPEQYSEDEVADSFLLD